MMELNENGTERMMNDGRNGTNRTERTNGWLNEPCMDVSMELINGTD